MCRLYDRLTPIVPVLRPMPTLSVQEDPYTKHSGRSVPWPSSSAAGTHHSPSTVRSVETVKKKSTAYVSRLNPRETCPASTTSMKKPELIRSQILSQSQTRRQSSTDGDLRIRSRRALDQARRLLSRPILAWWSKASRTFRHGILLIRPLRSRFYRRHRRRRHLHYRPRHRHRHHHYHQRIRRLRPSRR